MHLMFYNRNFDKVVKAAYRWIRAEYTEGDRSFLFGK